LAEGRRAGRKGSAPLSLGCSGGRPKPSKRRRTRRCGRPEIRFSRGARLWRSCPCETLVTWVREA
jgi:hypothetical protein